MLKFALAVLPAVLLICACATVPVVAFTKEDAAKKVLSFNHDILYRVINNRDLDIQVRMYCAKRIGSVHRNVYHFATEPTSRPGGDLVWLLSVPKGDTRDISFTFDSDDKNFREYLRYDDFDGGR